jgi:3-oxoacyl-[acyl-carrier protein] reductase
MRRLIAVTCATGGIGQAVCEQLATTGHDLVVFGRDQNKLENLRSYLSANPGCRVDTRRVDFDAQDDLRTATAEGPTAAQKLDGLVLIYPRAARRLGAIPTAAENAAAWHRCYFRPLELVGILLEQIASDGRVVIVSGISNSQTIPSLGAANVLRAAWLAQAKLLAFTLGERRIRVNTLSLGGTLTDRFIENLARSPQRGPLDDQPDVIPLGEYGMPQDVAYVVESMLGQFTTHMTGANIVCDGGLSRHYY